MPSIRLLRATAALACAATLAGCAATTAGHPLASGSSSPGTGSSTGTPADYPTTEKALAAKVDAATSALKSEHIDLRVESAGVLSISSEGDETLHDDRVTSSNLVESIPSFGTIRVITVGSTNYVQVPAADQTDGKPWAVVSPTSSNAFAQRMSLALQEESPFTGPGSVSRLFGLANSFSYLGTGKLPDGTGVGRYELKISFDKLPMSAAQKAEIDALGLSIGSVPLVVAIDAEGHVCTVAENINISQGSTPISVDVSLQADNFDNPVTVDAPPKSEVLSA